MQKIKEFNKEISKEILKIQEKRKDFVSKKIEEYSLAKNLKIKKTEDNFDVVNVEYVEDLLRNNKLKLISEYSTYLAEVKIYNFEELNILVKESNNNKNYKVLLSEEVIDLRDWNSDLENLEDFLNKYL